MSSPRWLSITFTLLLSTAAQAQNPLPHAPSAAPAIVHADDAQALQSIQSYCASEWQADAAIQSRCTTQQSEARTKALQFAATPSEGRSAIWSKCSRDWTNHNGFLDWIMMARCLDFQVEAYKQ